MDAHAVTQQVVNQSAGVIIGDTSIDFDTLLPDLESRLEAMDIGPLLGLWFQTLVAVSYTHLKSRKEATAYVFHFRQRPGL